MMEILFSPATTSFAVALCLMLVIALIEVLGAFFGLSPSSAVDNMLPEVDADVDFDTDIAGGPLDGDTPVVSTTENAGPLSQVLGWLCVGRVPVLVLLIVFLTAFGMLGFAIQGLADSLIGTPLPEFLAVIPALAGALPATRFSGLTLAKLIPKEETEAVSQAHFIGRLATITGGEARRGLAAEAKVVDQHGQAHYIRVEPDDAALRFANGTDVIVVSQIGGIYHVIENTSSAMIDSET
ncbi:MAG: YqiJ family protein [Pseudomonadota bacterium]